jgi:hypothetical protein
MMCNVLPSLVSWVFVECYSHETPGIQVGARNISYHSQITKQTAKLICQTVTLYTDNAGYIVYVDMDICVGGTMCEAVYLYVDTHVYSYDQQSDSHRYDGGVDCCGIRLYQCGGWMLSTTHLI